MGMLLLFYHLKRLHTIKCQLKQIILLSLSTKNITSQSLRYRLYRIARHTIIGLNHFLTFIIKSNYNKSKFYRWKFMLSIIILCPSSQMTIIITLLNIKYLTKSLLVLFGIFLCLIIQGLTYFVMTFLSYRLNTKLYSTSKEVQKVYYLLFNITAIMYNINYTLQYNNNNKIKTNQIACSRFRSKFKTITTNEQQQNLIKTIQISHSFITLKWKIGINYLERLVPNQNGEGIQIGCYLLLSTFFVNVSVM